MACEYCSFEKYYGSGDNFDFYKRVDESEQDLIMYIWNSIEDNGYIIIIDGHNVDMRISINYCPFCGQKLKIKQEKENETI
jgi:hypothetical protein